MQIRRHSLDVTLSATVIRGKTASGFPPFGFHMVVALDMLGGGVRTMGGTVTNLQYLAYGCIDTHYNGRWFDGVSDAYLNEFLTTMNSAPWPGGIK